MNSLSKRNKVREATKVLLDVVPNGEKIHLPKELLEELLFEELTVNKDLDLKVKIPIWSGIFLRNIDLSEVSFKNVCWQFPVVKIKDIVFEGINIDDDFNDSLSKLFYSAATDSDVIIDYSYTNAKIDLSESFEAINCNYVSTWNCNFNGVSFTNNSLSGVKKAYFIDSDFVDSNINLNTNIKVEAFNSDFTNLNLSKRTINGLENINFNSKHFGSCNLTNTSINIELDNNVLIDKILWDGCNLIEKNEKDTSTKMNNTK